MPHGQAILLGQLPSARQKRDQVSREQFLMREGLLAPWFEPLQILAKRGKKEEGGHGGGSAFGHCFG